MFTRTTIFLTILIFLISCDESSLDQIADPPNVIITLPTENTTVSGNVRITAMATSTVEIEKVNLWVDGLYVEDSDDLEEPYEFFWNTFEQENGSRHSIVVRAYDSNGNSTDSEILYLTVDNSGLMPNPLSLSVTYQDNNATLSWEISTDENFKEYQLFSSEESDMSSSEMVYSTENLNDTEFLIEDLVKGEAKYYQVKQINTYEFESSSNVIKVELVDDWEYFYTIDYKSDRILKFNKHAEIIDIINLTTYAQPQSRLYYFNNDLYFSQERRVYKILQDSLEQVHEYNENIDAGSFQGFAEIDGQVYGHIEKFSINQGRLTKLDQNNEFKQISSSSGNSSILAIASLNGKLYAYSESNDRLYEYGTQTGKISGNGSNSGLSYIHGMDGYGNYLYGIDIRTAPSNASKTDFYRLNLETGKNELLFTLDGVYSGLAFEK